MRRTRAQTQQRRTEMARSRTQRDRSEYDVALPVAPEHEAVVAEDDAAVSEDKSDEEQDAAGGGGDSMTEYERKRLENIQRNLDFMRSMGVSTAKIAARTAAAVPGKAQATATQRGISIKRKMREKPITPIRKSRRLEGKVAEELMMRDDRHPMAPKELRFIKKEELARFGANLDAEALNVDGAQSQQLLASILGGEYEEREEDLQVDASGVEVVAYTLREADVIKAVEERIYSIAFHPRTDRVVVACGDKRGNLALWNADAPEGDDSVVAMYRPHTLPATQLHFLPNDSTKLLSSSFDGTVRQFDLKAAKFTELFATDDHTGITSMALTMQPDQFMLSGDDGHIWTLDLRESPARHNGVLLHEKKVQTVHHHPLIEYCFATASLDRTVCLWDARKLKKTGNEALVTMPHHRSVNCAYFSPTGSHLVTVGQDDYINLYDTQDATHLNTNDIKPMLRIPHNNQTGRWLTKLHAAWNPKRPDEYVIGCMQQPRRIQIFRATRKSPVQELTSEYFASVHSINVFHPTQNLIAGGNSSGRMCLFRGEKEEPKAE